MKKKTLRIFCYTCCARNCLPEQGENVSNNKKAFLKLMKYTKQSPVYLEHDKDFGYISPKYAYTQNNSSMVRVICKELKKFNITYCH